MNSFSFYAQIGWSTNFVVSIKFVGRCCTETIAACFGFLTSQINIRRYLLRAWKGTGKSDSFSRDFHIPDLAAFSEAPGAHGFCMLGLERVGNKPNCESMKECA
jgi:hypothetical protein